MPKKGTKSQEEIFEQLECYFEQKGYKYLGYNGKKDDSHKFGIAGNDLIKEKIYCYVQFISIRATKRPKGSVEVYVRQNERNENVTEIFSRGNGFHGQGDRHVFVAPIDYAFKLIDTI